MTFDLGLGRRGRFCTGRVFSVALRRRPLDVSAAGAGFLCWIVNKKVACFLDFLGGLAVGRRRLKNRPMIGLFFGAVFFVRRAECRLKK